MLDNLKTVGRQFKADLKVYRLVIKDSRMPILAKGILWGQNPVGSGIDIFIATEKQINNV